MKSDSEGKRGDWDALEERLLEYAAQVVRLVEKAALVEIEATAVVPR
jgi:hypothetical protein